MTDFQRVLIFVSGLACIFSVGCGGGSSTPKTNAITPSGQNVAPITVNLGPGASQGVSYVNGAFASVTVCVPGTSTCQTVDGVLVDTGSSGLRILSSALTSVTLPQQKTSSGNPIVECLQFLSSYTWGPVQTADVQIAGEKAASLPIQVLSDTDFTAPTSCSDVSPSSQSADTLQTLGANGILGVGLFAQDCGSYCQQVHTGSFNPYYECTSSTSCQAMAESLAQQVANPVTLFTTDNNGVIVELPAVSGPEATLSGSLVFGIGTQSNNGLGSATVYTTDSTGNFSTTFNGTTFNETSFIDSGSNGYFFSDANITQCPNPGNAGGFYCPGGTMNLTAKNQGFTSGSGTVDFSVASAQTLFSANPSDAVFEDLAGPTGGSSVNIFDWGLPFFYGRNVYTAIESANTPGGAGPYWAY